MRIIAHLVKIYCAARYRAAIVNKTPTLFTLFEPSVGSFITRATHINAGFMISEMLPPLYSGSRSSPISSSANSSSIFCLPPTLVLGLE